MTNSTLNIVKIFSLMTAITMSSVAFASDLGTGDDLDAATAESSSQKSSCELSDERMRRLRSGDEHEFNTLLGVGKRVFPTYLDESLNFALCDKPMVLDQVKTLFKTDVAGFFEKYAKDLEEEEKIISQKLVEFLREGGDLEDMDILRTANGKNEIMVPIIESVRLEYTDHMVDCSKPGDDFNTLHLEDVNLAAAHAIVHEMLLEFRKKVEDARPVSRFKSAAKGV